MELSRTVKLAKKKTKISHFRKKKKKGKSLTFLCIFPCLMTLIFKKKNKAHQSKQSI